MSAYQSQHHQNQMAATISYLHSSLSMTPTSPQTSSTGGTPVPLDIGQMVFGSPTPTADQAVAKANSGRASVVVNQQPHKVIPPPPSLIPMSAAGSLLGTGGGGNKDMQKIQDTLQHLHNLKNLTATFVNTGGRNQQQQQQQSQSQLKRQRQDPLTMAGYGHYKNNPNLATIRPAQQQQQFSSPAVSGGSSRAGLSGGGNGSGGAVPEYNSSNMLRTATNTGGPSNSRGRSSKPTNLNTNSSHHHYLNQMLMSSTSSGQQSADVIDLSSTPNQRSNASAVAAAAQLQQHQQYLQQQYFQQQQQQAAAVAQQQQQQQRGGGNRGNGNAELANCLNLLAASGHGAQGGGQTVVGRGRGASAISDELNAAAANMMNKTAMANVPYKMQKQQIDGVQVTCINMKAYQHSDLLMRVQDLCDKFFPQSTHENCRRVLEVFNVVIYRGNR